LKLHNTAFISRLAVLALLAAGLLLIEPGVGRSENNLEHSYYLPDVQNGDPELVLYPTGDTEIRELYPENNYTDYLEMQVGAVDLLSGQRALIQFDLAGLPSDAVISEARFFICYYGWVDVYEHVHPVDFFLVTETWDPETVNWYSQPVYDNLIGSIDLPADNLSWGYYSLDMTAIVQGWQSGVFENDGVLIRTSEDESIPYYRTFFSREGEHPPKLVITYRR
jgi:hypothetical protein